MPRRAHKTTKKQAPRRKTSNRIGYYEPQEPIYWKQSANHDMRNAFYLMAYGEPSL